MPDGSTSPSVFRDPPVRRGARDGLFDGPAGRSPARSEAIAFEDRIEIATLDTAHPVRLRVGPAVLTRINLHVFAAHRSALRDHASWLRWAAATTQVISEPARLCPALRHTREGDMLIVDVDAFVDIGVALDMLARIRVEQPNLCVLIGSRAFACHDLTRTRSEVADGSIRLPVSPLTLARAMVLGLRNHAIRTPPGRATTRH